MPPARRHRLPFLLVLVAVLGSPAHAQVRFEPDTMVRLRLDELQERWTMLVVANTWPQPIVGMRLEAAVPVRFVNGTTAQKLRRVRADWDDRRSSPWLEWTGGLIEPTAVDSALVAFSISAASSGAYRFPLRLVLEDGTLADTAVFLYVRGPRLSPVRVRTLVALALAGLAGILWRWWRRAPRVAG
jgi:hypothetical protein